MTPATRAHVPADTAGNAATRVKVLALSSLFPNDAQPRHGIFLLHRLAHLATHADLDLRVVAPVPWFPSTHPIFKRYAVFAQAPQGSCQQGLRVLHPRYPVVPLIGMAIAPGLMALALWPRLMKLKRQGFDFDVIDAYYLYPDGVAAALLGQLMRRPVTLTALGTDVNLIPAHRPARMQMLWAIARSTAITTVCQALKAALCNLGVDASKTTVIEHGVDLQRFTPPRDRQATRAESAFTRPTLLSVGHLIARKGHDVAISALQHLPEMDLVIAGDGPMERALKRQVCAMGLSDRVRFLGHVDQVRLPALMGAADALVLCSDREGMANVLLEAMACGTPVVASAVWGSPEVVCTPEAGVLMKDRTASGLAEAVRRLLADPPDRAATRRYAARFSWFETAARHASLLRLAVQGPAAHGASETVTVTQAGGSTSDTQRAPT